MYKLAIILLRDSINQSTEKNQSGQICNNKLANAATPSIVYCCTSLFVRNTIWQIERQKCEPCTEWCAKVWGCKLWIQLYLSMQSCLLQPSFCNVSPRPPTYHPTPPRHVNRCRAAVAVMGGMGEVIRAMVWLQFVPNKWRLSAKFKPFSLLHHCQFSHIYLWSVTTTLLVQVIKGCPLALTWTVLVKWADDNFGRAPAGPIIDGENGHFQSSTKLCRFAGTK